MHPMEFLDDEAQGKARFGPFGDSANLDARYVIGLRRTYHRVRNHFRCTQWDSKVMRLKQKLIFSLFGDSANLDARHCTVCTEHTIGSEIVLDAPDETPR
jgi:hypothetical protein